MIELKVNTYFHWTWIYTRPSSIRKKTVILGDFLRLVDVHNTLLCILFFNPEVFLEIYLYRSEDILEEAKNYIF
jgi:hypothetical protein